MRLRLPLLGTGASTDPYRVDLPTYQMVRVDYVNRLALVEVPHADCTDALHKAAQPGELPHLAALEEHLKGGDLVALPEHVASLNPPPVRRLPPPVREGWWRHLDERYREHEGQYRPDTV